MSPFFYANNNQANVSWRSRKGVSWHFTIHTGMVAVIKRLLITLMHFSKGHNVCGDRLIIFYHVGFGVKPPPKKEPNNRSAFLNLLKTVASPPFSSSSPVPTHPITPSCHPCTHPRLPLSHSNRWDLQKNQFPLPGGGVPCFTTVSDWWRADGVSHPAAFYSTSVLVTIHCIFMANNNRRCNSCSLRRVNLSGATRRWPAQTAGGQSHVNKLLRLNDWVHSCEGLQPIQQSDLKAVLHIAAVQWELAVQHLQLRSLDTSADWTPPPALVTQGPHTRSCPTDIFTNIIKMVWTHKQRWRRSLYVGNVTH